MNGNFDLFLKRALELAGDFQPVDCPTEEDWRRAERELGWAIPGEHKQFVSRFGSGRFGSDLYLLNPRAKNAGRLGADALRTYASESALLLAESAPNGDHIVVDLQDGSTGYINHEENWGQSPRRHFIRVSPSLGQYLRDINSDESIVAEDYWTAKSRAETEGE